ncbi:hypothetical protein NQ314_000977 [Rhamnusium bicolor]|uniref:ZAD domain-containing protein n=1 Tax=Rhamnusium bicolor TaxID=1586634 RepID=A0AAV8ZT68_9CUCU|nr:hypothetical protein NQ314_000977 [Rhamnusium bicolor]
MSVTHDLCRLCASKNNLVCVFDKDIKNEENIRNVIFITTGVEIHKNDVISQKICEKCNQRTMKMFRFRKRCIQNDKRLKDACMQYPKTNIMEIPNKNVTIKHENYKPKEEPKQEPTVSTFNIHHSVKDLFRMYPQLRLPTPCISYHVAPFVSMPIDEVENYFKNRNLNMNEHVKLALNSIKLAEKTSSNIKIVDNSSNFSTNAEIISEKIKMFPQNSADKNNDNVDKHGNSNIPVKNNTNAINGYKKTVNPVKNNINVINGHKETISNMHAMPTHKDNLKKNVPENIQLHKKRKYSEIEKSSNKENCKRKFIESLGLMPNDNTAASAANIESLSLLSYIEKSVALHICNICNSVHDSAKELKKHRSGHLRCQFCKRIFRNLKNKSIHLDSECIIKNAMNNLPHVEIENIKYDLEIRKKYPKVFSDFPALENNHNTSSNATFEKIDFNLVKNQALATSIAEVNSNKVLASSEIVSNIFPIINPNVKIQNSSALDGIDSKASDSEVLRRLLINCKPSKLFAQCDTQTDILTNQSIVVDAHHSSAELKNLKQQLHTYKIPVVIKNGPFSVSYNYELDSKKPKILHSWNDLKPIDIKTKTTTVLPSYNIVKTDSEKHNLQNNNSMSLPLNLASNSLAVPMKPPCLTYFTTKPIMTNSVVDTSFQSNYFTSSANIKHKSSLVDNSVKTQNSSTSKPETVFAHIASSPCTSSPVPDTTVPRIGAIRVKNTCELF